MAKFADVQEGPPPVFRRAGGPITATSWASLAPRALREGGDSAHTQTVPRDRSVRIKRQADKGRRRFRPLLAKKPRSNRQRGVSACTRRKQ